MLNSLAESVELPQWNRPSLGYWGDSTDSANELSIYSLRYSFLPSNLTNKSCLLQPFYYLCMPNYYLSCKLFFWLLCIKVLVNCFSCFFN